MGGQGTAMRPGKQKSKGLQSATLSPCLFGVSGVSLPHKVAVCWITSGWYVPTPDQTFGDKNCSCYESSSVKTISGMVAPLHFKNLTGFSRLFTVPVVHESAVTISRCSEHQPEVVMIDCRTRGSLCKGALDQTKRVPVDRPAAGACRQRYRGKLRVPKAILRHFCDRDHMPTHEISKHRPRPRALLCRSLASQLRAT